MTWSRSIPGTILATVLCCAMVAAQLPNDECSGAIPVVLGHNPGFCGLYSNAGATTSAGYPAICNTISSDLWYAFTPPLTGAYTLDTDTQAFCSTGTETDTVLAVYASCAAGATPIGCDDDGGTGTLSKLTVGLCANQTYFIRIGSFGAQSATNNGTYYLSISVDVTTFTQIVCTAPGCVQIMLVNGPANGMYFLPATTNVGTFPNGWLFGIDITVQDINNELNAGFPFVGTLNTLGSTTIGPVCGLPSGFTFCSVALGFLSGSGLGIPQVVTQPVCTTIP